MQVTPKQLKHLFASLRALELGSDARAGLVDSFTAGRTESSAELTQSEADALLAHLRQLQYQAKAKGDVLNQLRRGIIAACHNMRWYVRDPQGLLITKNGRAQIDYQRIDAYCLSHTACKLKMSEQNKEQLQSTFHQFKNMATAYLKQNK